MIYSKKKIKKIYNHTKKNTKKHNTNDKILDFINVNIDKLLKGYVFHHSSLDKTLFNHFDKNCICENIFKQKIMEGCKCNNIELYPSQGKSVAKIYSIDCSNKKNKGTNIKQILKVMSFSNYYIKLNQETKQYIYLETDKFTNQTLIHYYVYRELPLNCINIVNFGICKNPNENDTYNKYYGYNLMDKADIGDGNVFITGLIEGIYDREFGLSNSKDRYNAVINFLLQSMCIKGHLQSSNLELLHGDYKSNNLLIRRVSSNDINFFKFNVFDRIIKIKNIGFAVLIADFGTSSLSLNCKKYKKKYRIVPVMNVEKTKLSYINEIIRKYADVEPNNYELNKYSRNIFNTNLFPPEQKNIVKILWLSGLKLYLDFDLYIYVVKLLNMPIIKKYIIDNSLDKNIFSFIDGKVFREILKYQEYEISINRILLLITDICEKLKIFIKPIFTEQYIEMLERLSQ